MRVLVLRGRTGDGALRGSAEDGTLEGVKEQRKAALYAAGRGRHSPRTDERTRRPARPTQTLGSHGPAQGGEVAVRQVDPALLPGGRAFVRCAWPSGAVGQDGAGDQGADQGVEVVVAVEAR